MLLLTFLQFSLTYTSPVGNNVCRSFSDYATIETNRNCYYNEDVDLSASQIVKKYGFPFETYKVKTEDGYILSLFRIPHDGKDQKSSRQPVVLQHGLSSSASLWLLRGKESLAFFLVNNGYDVWLPNIRGSIVDSMGHENVDITEKEYWNFSFHEMGTYDLPAYIEFISKATGKYDGIIYIGHSMGATMSSVYLSLKNNHAEKYLKMTILLAPVVYLKHIQGLFLTLHPYKDVFKDTLEALGFFGVGQFTELQNSLAKVICNTYPLIIFCQALYSYLNGLTLDQIKPEIFPIATTNLLRGTSLKTLNHYGQLISAHGRFQFYDYGPKVNMVLYNSTLPPEYPVEEIFSTVHLFAASNDVIAEYKDVNFLYEKLRCNKSLHMFRMAHNDFVFGRYVDSFYQTLLKVMKSA